MQAFARGCGGSVDVTEQWRGGASCFYGVTPSTLAIYRAALASGYPWWYVDHAYFQRGEFWRVTRGAQQHSGIGQPDYRRFDALGVEIEPWRSPGRHIVVCLQSEWWFQRSLGISASAWTKGIVAELRRHTDREIVVRDKADISKSAAPKTVAASRASFREAIRGAHAVVTYQSNAAVEAICAGVPAFVTGQSAAEPVASGALSNIEAPARPDGRREWAAVLAANQWTIEEIAAGDTWRTVRGDWR